MASSNFSRFLRNQSYSANRIISLLNKQITCEPPSLQTSPLLVHPVESDNRPSQSSVLPQTEAKISRSGLTPRQFYPSFSTGLFLSPISFNGFIEHDVSDELSGDSPTIWADSVKKKRKRKMNKHKLRKLRKRLRRKT